MRNFFLFFLPLFFVTAASSVEAKHACVIGKPLESCSHESVSCTDIPQNMRFGNSSANVSSLQNYLFTFGYLKANPTGYFGSQTLAAVKEFQKVHTIDQTGFVGPLTRTQIKTNSCKEPVPVVCPTLAKLCPDGSVMPKSISTCEWYPDKCLNQNTTSSSSLSGVWSTWNSASAATSSTLLDSLKKLFISFGIPTNFATTSMSESEILQMTKNFERDYISK